MLFLKSRQRERKNESQACKKNLPLHFAFPVRPRSRCATSPAAVVQQTMSNLLQCPTWPLWGSSLRAPSVAGDLPPPQRPTRFSQPPATLLPANRGGQAGSPMARPARRSVAPRQQHQPGLRAAASSSAEHGQISHRIFVPRPGHTVMSGFFSAASTCAAGFSTTSHMPTTFQRRIVRISRDFLGKSGE
eukprot:COSAG06_NODE_1053_length_10949_cov_15.790968_10_plen_189_part_00